MSSIGWSYHNDIDVYEEEDKFVIDIDPSKDYKVVFPETNDQIRLPSGTSILPKEFLNESAAVLTKNYLNDCILNPKSSEKEVEILPPEDVEITSVEEIDGHNFCVGDDLLDWTNNGDCLELSNMVIGQRYNLVISLKDSSGEKEITLKDVSYKSGKIDLGELRGVFTVRTPRNMSGEIHVEFLDVEKVKRDTRATFEVGDEEYKDITVRVPEMLKVGDKGINEIENPYDLYFNGEDYGDDVVKKEVSPGFVNLTGVSNKCNFVFNVPTWLSIDYFDMKQSNRLIDKREGSPPDVIWGETGEDFDVGFTAGGKTSPSKISKSKKIEVNQQKKLRKKVDLGDKIRNIGIEVFINGELGGRTLLLDTITEDSQEEFLISKERSLITVSRDDIEFVLYDSESETELEKFSLSEEEILYTRSVVINLEN